MSLRSWADPLTHLLLPLCFLQLGSTHLLARVPNGSPKGNQCGVRHRLHTVSRRRPSSVSVAVLEAHVARKRSTRSAHSFGNRVRHLLVRHLQRNLKKVQQRQRSNANRRVRMGFVPHQMCLQVVAQAILTRRPSWPGHPISVLESLYPHPAPRPKLATSLAATGITLNIAAGRSLSKGVLATHSITRLGVKSRPAAKETARPGLASSEMSWGAAVRATAPNPGGTPKRFGRVEKEGKRTRQRHKMRDFPRRR